MLRVRRASVADGPVLAHLIDEIGATTNASDVADRLRSLPEGHAVLVAERGASVVGFVHVAVDPSLHGEDRAQVSGIAVAAEHRGAGVGARLVDEAAAWAREHGCHQLWIRSTRARPDAHGFYDRVGFDVLPDPVVFRRAIEGAVDQAAPQIDGAGPVVVRTTPSV